jgi:hypothetical protein
VSPSSTPAAGWAADRAPGSSCPSCAAWTCNGWPSSPPLTPMRTMSAVSTPSSTRSMSACCSTVPIRRRRSRGTKSSTRRASGRSLRFEVRGGDRLRGFDPVALEILGPWPGLHGQRCVRRNAGSIWRNRDSADGRYRAGGRASPPRRRAARDIDVLKVAHHGSATSTTRNFSTPSRPRSRSSAPGRNNRFGHPSPEVMERLASADHRARTDESGTLRLQTDGHGCGSMPTARPEASFPMRKTPCERLYCPADRSRRR